MRQLGLLALALITGACVGSVQPIYTSADAVFDSTLVGTWGDSSGQQVVITRAGGAEYALAYTSEDHKPAKFSAHLVRLRGVAVMDVTPTELPDTYPDEYRSMYLPLHVFFIVDSRRDQLRFAGLNPAALKRYLTRNPRSVGYATGGKDSSDIVLTAGPAALQAFLLAYRSEADAFTDTTVWLRRDGRR
jgi:hypothetical protein